ncbi:sulfur carrier protein ThiS [Tenacibaculum geojense]|uniref:Sulfur carrier protein ThiS n=1 Tax=Tenacibaculum geojense TaxID=915352 RepID=A0ABW3JRK7_9FLAO
MITIKVNDNTKQIQEQLTVANLIDELKIQSNGIAIAINNSIVKKEDWHNVQVVNNDNILIIQSTQGG